MSEHASQRGRPRGSKNSPEANARIAAAVRKALASVEARARISAARKHTLSDPVKRAFWLAATRASPRSNQHDADTIAVLRGHWDAGHPTGTIAALMGDGWTKGMVVGVANRNDFPARPSPIRHARWR